MFGRGETIIFPRIAVKEIFGKWETHFVNFRKFTAVIIVVSMVLLLPMVSYGKEKRPLEAVATYLGCEYEDLLLSEKLVPGDAVSDWFAIVAGCSGEKIHTKTYLKGLQEYVTRKYKEEGGLHTIKATEYHRISLAILALGGDPTNFGEDGSGNPINLISDGTYHWQMSDSLGLQGLNAWIFALITLDSKGYEIPEDAIYTREDMMTEILKSQTEEGGFGLSFGSSDVDITAMAIQSLAPYYSTHREVQEAVDRAVWWLSVQQGGNGDFQSWESGNAEGTAQTIIALCSLGIHPEKDERFVKNGKSAVDGLLQYQCENGMFRHTIDGEADFMATQQAVLALLSLKRLEENEDRIYDMSAVNPFGENVQETKDRRDVKGSVWIPIGIILGLAGVVVILISMGGKKKHV